MYRKSLAVLARACLVVSLIGFCQVALAEYKEKFVEEVRSQLLANTADHQWSTDCYQASNGLTAVTSLHFDSMDQVELITIHFFDADCQSKAGLVESVKGVPRTASLPLRSVGRQGRPDVFSILSGGEALIFQRRGDRLQAVDNRLLPSFEAGVSKGGRK